jgi:hypothetical protein
LIYCSSLLYRCCCCASSTPVVLQWEAGSNKVWVKRKARKYSVLYY